MSPEEIQELTTLKIYVDYLNQEGLLRLVHLWGKEDHEREEARRNGM